MTTAHTTPMSQLTFVWPEIDAIASASSSKANTIIPLGIAAPAVPDRPIPPTFESRIIPASLPKETRRGRPEHISDLLLVVLDRYGIDPNEFLAGLQ